ncbi:hypothetical protein HZS_1556, partial [Henneguya salminicola]
MFIVKCIFLLSLYLIHQQDYEKILILSQMIIRHGNRTPKFIYPHSPCPGKYYPDGLGEITNDGLRLAYRFGEIIRQRYMVNEKTKILSGNYYKEIYAHSSGSDRCIQTAQAVLAGLYEPSNSRYNWNEKLAWFPIPIKSTPPNKDEFLDSQSSNPLCGKIPPWLTQKYLLEFERITFELLEIYYIHKIEDQISKLLGGPLLKTLIHNMDVNTKDLKRKKLYLYSAVNISLKIQHDSTLYHLFSALEIELKKYIQFASAITIELYQTKSKLMHYI